MSIGMLFSRTKIGSSDFSYAAAPVGTDEQKWPTASTDIHTLGSLDDDICYTIANIRRRACIPLLHPIGKLDVRLLSGVVCAEMC